MALAPILEAFQWGKGGQRMTPQQIAREQEIAAALGVADTSPVDHWLQGAARLTQAAVGKYRETKANKAEAENATYNQDLIASLFGGSGGVAGAQGAFPVAPAPAGGQTASAPAAMPTSANAQAIRSGLVERGLPEHVADGFLMNFQDESGLNPGINEAAPLVPGSRGGYGLYQLTGPRRRAYEAFAQQRGISPDSVDGQLDFLMTELQGPEAKAAQSIFASQDAGTAAAAIAKDFLRPSQEHLNRRIAKYTSGGGRSYPAEISQSDIAAINSRPRPADASPYSGPGATIAQGDIQAAGAERAAREQAQLDAITPPAMLGMLGGGAQPPAAAAIDQMAGQPVQTASLDPSVGVAQALATPQAAPAMGAPQTVQDMPVANQQIAQALTGSNVNPDIPMMGGGGSVGPVGQMQTANGGINPAIIQALSDPYASQQVKGIAGMLLQNQMQQQAEQNDPMRAMQLEKAQLELEAMRNPQKKPIEVGGVLLDPDTMQPIFDSREGAGGFTLSPGQQRFDAQGRPIAAAQPEPGFRQLSPQEAQQFNLDPSKGWQVGPDNRVYEIGGGGVTVTNNMGEGDKFYEQLDKNNATSFSAMSDAGVSARSKLAQIDRLQGLLANSPQGMGAGFTQMLGEYGLPTQGVGELQAAQALINELVPQQRQPGSGPMSDADLALFKQSLPRIINQPGSNKLILDTMRGISEYQIQMGEIADRVANREMTAAQGRDAIRALSNPLAGFKTTAGDGDSGAVPAGVDPEDWKFMSPEDRRLFQ
jgi:hypothetical protein